MQKTASRLLATVAMATCLAGAPFSASPANAQADPTVSCTSPSSVSTNPAQYVNDYITALRVDGESLDEVQDDLADDLCLQRIDSGGSLDAAQPTNTDELSTDSASARALSDDPTPIDPVDPDDPNSPDNPEPASASDASAITITAPAISYDSQAHLYYAIGYWKWTKNTWTGEINYCPNCNKTIGGTDGFAVALSQQVTMKGYSATAGGDTPMYPASWNIAGPYVATNTGAGYAFQDRGGCSVNATFNCVPDLNVRSGQLVTSFTGLGGCKSVQGFATYGHSWSSTKVSGFGITTSGASIAWSTTSHQWTRASQPGAPARVC